MEGQKPGDRIVGQKAAWQGWDHIVNILNPGLRTLPVQ